MTSQSPTTVRREALTASDDRRILLDIWPAENTVAIIHIFHGLGEHPARYERFARQCNERGITVAAHNHRGHGENCPVESLGHYDDSGGWQKVIDDAALAQQFLREAYPDIPLILLGHSMGSYVAQHFSMQHDYRLTALVLSASTWPMKAKLFPGLVIANIEALRLGIRGKSRLLDKLGFGDFNKPFQPARTEFDWLSRDEAEVDAYISDPLCGGPYSCGLWLAVLGGLRAIASDQALERIRSELPILLTGGSEDPVGGQKGIEDRIRDAIADLVGMPLGDGFAGEDVIVPRHLAVPLSWFPMSARRVFARA